MEAINQGVCENCDKSDDNYFQFGRTHDMPSDEDEHNHAEIEREIRCKCGEECTVTTTETGIETAGPISLDDATWNDDSDESSDE